MSSSMSRRIVCLTATAALVLPAGTALARPDFPVPPRHEPPAAPAAPEPVRISVDDGGLDWPSAGIGGGVVVLAALGAAGTAGFVRRHHRLAA